MAERQFGGNIPVDFTSVLKTLEAKLATELRELHQMLSTSEGIHDFEAFNAKTVEMQATVRTIDLLQGKVRDIYGTSFETAYVASEVEPQLVETLERALNPEDHLDNALHSVDQETGDEDIAA